MTNQILIADTRKNNGVPVKLVPTKGYEWGRPRDSFATREKSIYFIAYKGIQLHGAVYHFGQRPTSNTMIVAIISLRPKTDKNIPYVYHAVTIAGSDAGEYDSFEIMPDTAPNTRSDITWWKKKGPGDKYFDDRIMAHYKKKNERKTALIKWLRSKFSGDASDDEGVDTDGIRRRSRGSSNTFSPTRARSQPQHGIRQGSAAPRPAKVETDGKDGAPGKDGKKGDKGDKGNKGEKGDDGIDGIDGEDGARGAAGKDGAPGKIGKTGASGKDGKQGEKGGDGKDGARGENGKDAKPTSQQYSN